LFSTLRKILISGASRGIGKRIAEAAINEGHYISLGLRKSYKFDKSALKISNSDESRLIISEYDAKDKNSCKEWVRKTKIDFGSIDTLIHCAGIFKKTELNFRDKEEKDIDDLWKTNVMGPWHLTRAAWEYLIEVKNSRVIVLVSMSGIRSKGSFAGYSTSKFALMGLSETIRNEGWDKGLRVTTICPGWVNTDMSKEVKSISRKEMTQPEDIGIIINTLLKLPNSCIPFNISINCNLEK